MWVVENKTKCLVGVQILGYKISVKAGFNMLTWVIGNVTQAPTFLGLNNLTSFTFVK